MYSSAGFAYRGGNLLEERIFSMGGILVEHPKGKLLFDTGFGKNVAEHFKIDAMADAKHRALRAGANSRRATRGRRHSQTN